MATVVGLNRGTWDHSFHLCIRHLPLTLQMRRRRKILFHVLAHTAHHPSKTHGVGWERSALMFSSSMWRHKAVPVENLRVSSIYVHD